MIDTKPEEEILAVRKMDYDGYFEARTEWQSVATDQTKFLDQSSLTLAGGALGLSLTFLHDSVSAPLLMWSLYAGGSFLLSSIVLTLGSVHTSQHAIERYIRKLDEAAIADFSAESLEFLSNRYVNAAARITFWLNALSSTALVLGIAFVAYFAYYNLDSSNQTGQKMETNEFSNVIAQKGAVPVTPAVARPLPQSPQVNPSVGTQKK